MASPSSISMKVFGTGRGGHNFLESWSSSTEVASAGCFPLPVIGRLWRREGSRTLHGRFILTPGQSWG